MVFVTDEKNKTILTHAVQRGSPKLVKCILEYYPNVDQKDSRGKSALFYAVRRGNKAVIMLLMKARANLFDHSVRGMTDVMDELQLTSLYSYLKKHQMIIHLTPSKHRWSMWSEIITKVGQIDIQMN